MKLSVDTSDVAERAAAPAARPQSRAEQDSPEAERRRGAAASGALCEDARRRLCAALSAFATGVTVVTARAGDGSKLGITANSFNSVSLDPPLILFSLARSLLSFDEFLRAPAYAVNVLRVEQREICQHFGRASGAKWSGVRCEEGLHGVPLLADRLALFECTPYAQYDGGDHVILVGRVVRFEADVSREPLVFYGGSLRSLAERHRVGEDLAFMCGWGG